MSLSTSKTIHIHSAAKPGAALRIFSKLTCLSTLLLIFIGGMVTSTGSGLAVPDWPLSYGMLFPPMVGGVFYEHGHRMVATTVGFLVLCLAIWLKIKEQRRWVRRLGSAALILVVVQGILGGITVKFFLPAPVSILHGVLAQTFFVLTIILAYSQSIERKRREEMPEEFSPSLIRMIIIFAMLVYLQLILGAVMRHTGSGLSIPDFPTMGGYWVPPFNESMLTNINNWRFDHDLTLVTMPQVVIHFIHRLMVLIIFIFLCILNVQSLRSKKLSRPMMQALYWLNGIVLTQIALGILTVLTLKAPVITSLHVVTGAATLGISILMILRVYSLSFKKTYQLFALS